MADERVYSLADTGPSAAEEVSLSSLGHKERADLQRWILNDPALIEAGLLVLTEEYAAWTSPDGGAIRDRLDILALDQVGRTVVVELKRDDAPSDVHLQAITYAALVSRFTLSDVVSIAQRFSERGGESLTQADVETRLRDHVGDDLSEDLLKSPRIILVAKSFPAQVTASAVWLNERGLDVKLVQIRAWQAGTATVLTSSVVYPVPGAEDFIVEPDRRRWADVEKVATQRSRARKAVTRIVEGGEVRDGAPFHVHGYTELPLDKRAQVLAWIDEEPGRGRATWVNDRSRPLRWAVDNRTYTPTALIQKIVTLATGEAAPPMWGTRWWVDASDRDLVELAEGVE